jgi:osmotically-inducible protein OsmY
MGRRLASTLTAAVALLLVLPQAESAALQAPARDLTQQFRAGGVAIADLRVYEVGGIVIIRGRATDKAKAEQAGAFAKASGFSRVANLVQIVEPVNDAVIERTAERELSIHRGLDGCKFRIASRGGVVHLSGQVQGEFQKDMAVQLVRNIDGVREVRSELSR